MTRKLELSWKGERAARRSHISAATRRGFVLIDACPRFPILHNAEETIRRPCKAAQLRHSAYCSHLKREAWNTAEVEG